MMTQKDCKYTIEGVRTATTKIKRSVFICTLVPVESLEEARQCISRISKENKTATHNCWAYVLGENGEICHSSDAGEPSGTAGKPMLNTLTGYDMTHVAAVVTRHYGGVKLGVRGLIEAYSEAVKAALEMKKRIKRVQTVPIKVRVSYDFNDVLLNQLARFLSKAPETVYTESVEHTLHIFSADCDEAVRLLSTCRSQGKLQFSVLEED